MSFAIQSTFMNKKNEEDLAVIRSLMEQSSRFISLSGWSGVFAGSYAIVAALIAFILFKENGVTYFEATRQSYSSMLLMQLLSIGCITLVLAVSTGIYLTVRKSKKRELPIWNAISKKLIINLFIPIVVGGVFCLALYIHSNMVLIAPATLIFYGLGLINASKYTFNDIRYLGYSELLLGLIALFFTGYGLLFWTLGFGVMHIIYGILIQRKYQ